MHIHQVTHQATIPGVRRTAPCRLIAAGAVALAVSMSIGAARSQDDDGTRTRSVSAHGIDLASAEGRTEIARRIELAVRRVCDDNASTSLAERNAYEACHDDSMAGAHRQVQVLIARARGDAAIEVADNGPGPSP